jgi:hypothetical protein
LGLGEEICKLKFRSCVLKINSRLLAMGAYKAGINTNVLSELMLDRIVGNLNSTGASRWRIVGSAQVIPKSVSSQRSQIISAIVVARALSSASALDQKPQIAA